MPAKAVAADTGWQIVFDSIFAAFVPLNHMIDFPCALLGLALLDASAGEKEPVAAEVAVAGGAGEDEFVIA